MKLLNTIIFSLILVVAVNAQSKKDLIVKLTNRADSLSAIVNQRNSDLIQKEMQLGTMQNIIAEKERFILDIENQLHNLKQEIATSESNLEKSLAQNKMLLEKKELSERSLIKHKCTEAIGNSESAYPIRISGKISGCIGDDCDEVPSDSDLHKAIMALNDDFDQDGIIGVGDLESAVNEITDRNADGKMDIYDLIYPSPLKIISAVNNPSSIREDNGSSYILTGEISPRGDRLILQAPLNISYLNWGEGQSKYLTEKRSQIYLVASDDIIVCRNRKVVIKGKIQYGITQSYIDGFIFLVEEIIGVVN